MFQQRRGFSLAECLAALTIGSMVLVAVLGIYNRAQRSSESIKRRLDDYLLPTEVLQRIAEDVDNIIASDDKNIKISIPKSQSDHSYKLRQLKIERFYYDNQDKQQVFEKINWQTAYDFDSDSLILYRSHSGIGLEDKLLDKSKEDWERELFIPICGGITFFDIQVQVGDKLIGEWLNDTLPKAIVVTISFAQPYEGLTGELEVAEEDKITRTIAIDRSRKIKFEPPDPNAFKGTKIDLSDLGLDEEPGADLEEETEGELETEEDEEPEKEPEPDETEPKPRPKRPTR